MEKASNIVVKILAIALLTAAVLKGWQLLTEPVANNDIWSYRPFLILTVEFELALAIWLLSGLFKKAAWLATLLCFSAFSAITLYKGISGAESCGCFGPVHVNPWITLFAIELPAVIALIIFRPVCHPERSEGSHFKILNSLFSTGHLAVDIRYSPRHFVTTASIALLVLGVTTPILAFNEPAMVTSSYEVLEPETWVGKELPILEHIDIAESLKKGTWLVLLYHYDCPDCGTAIPKYENIARDLQGNEDFLRIALIAVPPYGRDPVSENCHCVLGRLAETKEWFVTTPAVVLLVNGKVTSAWEEKAPDFETILQNIAKNNKTIEKSRFFASTNHLTHSLYFIAEGR